MFSKFLSEEDGQTLIEYGLLISLLALAVITALTFFGQRVNNHFNIISNQLPGN
jgi:pilus assembly protein Flp/PilA